MADRRVKKVAARTAAAGGLVAVLLTGLVDVARAEDPPPASTPVEVAAETAPAEPSSGGSDNGSAPAPAAEQPAPDAPTGEPAAMEPNPAEGDVATAETVDVPADESTAADDGAAAPAASTDDGATAAVAVSSDDGDQEVHVAALPPTSTNPGRATTTTGQELNIVITEGRVNPDGTVDVEGQVSLGTLGLNVHIIYVVDSSGSTSGGADDCNGDGTPDDDVGDDFDGDGDGGEIIDCEIAGAVGLNRALLGSGARVSLVDFDSSGFVVDLDPVAPGVQVEVDPEADADGDGTPDVEEALRALNDGGGTDFDDALAAANAIIDGIPVGEQIIIVFLTDGQGSFTQPGSAGPIDQTIAAGAQIITVSVGTGAAGCGAGSDLQVMADATSGECFEVTDPSTLPALLESLDPVGIAGVTVALNGGVPVPVDLDPLGRFSIRLPGGVVGGENTIEAKATADDGTVATAKVVLGQPPAVAAGGLVRGGVDAGGLVRSGGELARTGNDVGVAVLLATGLLLVGFGMVNLRPGRPSGAASVR